MTPSPRHRHLLAATLVPLGLAGSFAAGVALTSTPASTTRPAAAPLRAEDPDPCTALLRHYQSAALDLLGPAGWGGAPAVPYDTGTLVAPQSLEGAATGSVSGSARADAAAGVPGTTRAGSSATGTTVQEAGVDEPDTVKTDGTLLVRVVGSSLVVADVTGSAVAERARLPLGLESAELLLAGDTVVVVGTSGARLDWAEGVADTRSTQVLSIDVSDPARPQVTARVDYDSGLVSARRHGDVIRLVLDAGLPRLDFVRPDGRTGVETARAANEQVVRDTTIEDWLPARSVEGGSGPGAGFLDCADVHVPRDDLGLDTTTVVGFGANSPEDVSSLAVAGSLPLAYESTDHLYLATGGTSAVLSGPVVSCLDRCPLPVPLPVPLPGGPFTTTGQTTHVVDLSLEGREAAYEASGEVAGRLSDRWSLDESDGVLRLALEPTSETGPATSVVTMVPDTTGSGLVEVGRLDGIGRGEELKAVRWFDDLAVLVTFRQVDPLSTVDLSEPGDPRELGHLEVPGYSDYLHPLGTDRLLGIGQGPAGPRGRWAPQAGLFDVTDLRDVRRLDTVSYPVGSVAGASTDPRQLTWLPARRTVLTVLTRGWRSPVGLVSVLHLDHGRLEDRLVRVGRGSEVAGLRLVPLPDDRVVLVGSSTARFLDLDRELRD